MVSGSISLPSPGFFSFFSRPTAYTIGHRGILSLRRWTSLIHTGFHVSGATWVVVRKSPCFRLRDCHPLWSTLSSAILLAWTFLTPVVVSTLRETTPSTPNTQRVEASTCIRFGLFPFRSPLLRKSLLLYFPGGTKMFQFSPFASPSYGFR